MKAKSSPIWVELLVDLDDQDGLDHIDIYMIMIGLPHDDDQSDPGCQEVEDHGLRYAGTATVTVNGR